MNDYSALSAAVFAGDSERVLSLCRHTLTEGLSPVSLFQQGLLSGLDKVNEGFRRNEILVPQMLLSERAFQKGTSLLRPFFPSRGKKAAIGTLPGDLHENGKNLIGLVLESEGFFLIDLGTEAPASAFLSAAKQGCSLLCCSLSMPASRDKFCQIAALLKHSPSFSEARLILGGSAADEALLQKSGADGYARTATETILLIRNLFPQ